MSLHDFLLLVCIVGGSVGAIFAAARRDISGAMLGLIVVAIAAVGILD